MTKDALFEVASAHGLPCDGWTDNQCLESTPVAIYDRYEAGLITHTARITCIDFAPKVKRVKIFKVDTWGFYPYDSAIDSWVGADL